MLYIVDQDKVYNAVDGMAVPVNVSAERNKFTGELMSYTIEPVGEPVELECVTDIATVEEVIARFGCAEKAYTFPKAKATRSAKSKTAEAE